MGRLGILAPDHDQPRAVADLAQRGGRRATQRDRRGARPGAVHAARRDQRSEAIGQGDRGARVLDRGVVEAVQQRTPRTAQQLGGTAERRFDVRRLAADRRRRCARTRSRTRSENHRRPSWQAGCSRTASPEASTVTSSHSRPQPAQVIGPHVSHGPAPRLVARPAGGPRARRAPARSAVAEISVHTGAPRLIVSPACGTSRTRPAGHQPGSGARSVAVCEQHELHLRTARRRRRCRRRETQAARAADVRLEAARVRTARVAPGGRGLTSSTQAWRPSQIASTPNAPRTPNRAATSSQTARS